MCIIAFELNAEGLRLTANRDEFFDRPALPLHRWPGKTGILAGKDLKAGGTWLGITEGGRFAFLTNYRDFRDRRNYPRSRGELVLNFLNSEESPENYIKWAESEKGNYDGYNLVVGDGVHVWYFSNRGKAPSRLKHGVYGLSNGFLNDPWPKVRRVTQHFTSPESRKAEFLFGVFRDSETYSEGLPDTGVGPEMERALSSIFIRHGNYGSRVTSVLELDQMGGYIFMERTYDIEGTNMGTRSFYSAS